ncbi:13712_t:CDS:2 [Entrophospora sp. SA101]|nr:13712_t:CDS:2 [Entrophospora sp. SA101]
MDNRISRHQFINYRNSSVFIPLEVLLNHKDKKRPHNNLQIKKY